MRGQEKMAVPKSSIGVDGEQSLNKNYYNDSITDTNRQDNLQVTSNSDLKSSKKDLQTVTMMELYDETYQPKIPVIENLLYNGMYLFAGAPKIGKSFLVAQLGYYVSKGIPLWNYKVNKGTVLYLALLPDMELQPNALARKLNVLRERLMLEANVWYSKERKNDKRVIILQWISKEE